MISTEVKKSGYMGVLCILIATLCRYYVLNIQGIWNMSWGTQGPFWELVLPGGYTVFMFWISGFLFLFVGVPVICFLDNYDLINKIEGEVKQ